MRGEGEDLGCHAEIPILSQSTAPCSYTRRGNKEKFLACIAHSCLLLLLLANGSIISLHNASSKQAEVPPLFSMQAMIQASLLHIHTHAVGEGGREGERNGFGAEGRRAAQCGSRLTVPRRRRTKRNTNFHQKRRREDSSSSSSSSSLSA